MTRLSCRNCKVDADSCTLIESNLEGIRITSLHMDDQGDGFSWSWSHMSKNVVDGIVLEQDYFEYLGNYISLYSLVLQAIALYLNYISLINCAGPSEEH